MATLLDGWWEKQKTISQEPPSDRLTEIRRRLPLVSYPAKLAAARASKSRSFGIPSRCAANHTATTSLPSHPLYPSFESAIALRAPNAPQALPIQPAPFPR